MAFNLPCFFFKCVYSLYPGTNDVVLELVRSQQVEVLRFILQWYPARCAYVPQNICHDLNELMRQYRRADELIITGSARMHRVDQISFC